MTTIRKILRTLVIANIIVWSLLFVLENQNRRLNNTYTTVIRDGEVIRMTQREFLDYCRNR